MRINRFGIVDSNVNCTGTGVRPAARSVHFVKRVRRGGPNLITVENMMQRTLLLMCRDEA